MQFKLFTIPASGDPGAEEELNRFLRSQRVVTVKTELIQPGNAPCWCFLVEYLQGGTDSNAKSATRNRVDYKQVLSETDFALYSKLREIRKQLADSESIPVYAICTNEQLAEMVTTRARKLADLKKVNGFGEAKCNKYGEALLAAINKFTEDKETHEANGKPD